MWNCPGNVLECSDLHNRTEVFIDRNDAGQRLARLLESRRGSGALVTAIPAGGVPVASVIAERLELPLDVLVVSKMTLPWNSEAGYGAVAADGTVRVNHELAATVGMDQKTIDSGIEKTRKKVAQRERRYHSIVEPRALKDQTVILVDDGLASGFTMRVAVDSARAQGAAGIIVAAPTGLAATILVLANTCDQIYCANIREGRSFAVADAYQHWCDVTEQEVIAHLEKPRVARPGVGPT